ncbi:hypothetical protein L7F22_023990, partial [Adiantum nelumboides]|nr:hypothetical protein [Adiantum nelumboides]
MGPPGDKEATYGSPLSTQSYGDPSCDMEGASFAFFFNRGRSGCHLSLPCSTVPGQPAACSSTMAMPPPALSSALASWASTSSPVLVLLRPLSLFATPGQRLLPFDIIQGRTGLGMPLPVPSFLLSNRGQGCAAAPTARPTFLLHSWLRWSPPGHGQGWAKNARPPPPPVERPLLLFTGHG